MTKSTITRERLEQLANFKGAPVTRQEEQELASIALAAMDSEPDCKERKLFCSTDTTRMRKTISVSAGTEDAPLYRHPQPAAPAAGNSITVIVSHADIFDVEGGKTYAAGKMIDLDTLRDYLAEHKIKVEVN